MKAKSKNDLEAVWGSVEQELRIQDVPFLELFEVISDGIAVYRAVDGGEDFVIVDVNSSCERLTKVERKNATGRRVRDVFPGIEKMGLLDVFRRVTSTGKSEELPVSLYDDGRLRFWVENKVFSIAPGMIVAVFTDVTERKIAQDAIEESESRFRMLVENSVELVYQLGADGTILYVSPSSQRMMGFSPEEVVGKKFVAFIHPDDMDFVVAEFEAGLKGNIDPSEFRLLHRNGSVKWVRTTTRPLEEDNPDAGLTGVMADVTERKKVEDELVASESRYRSIVENNADGMLVTDCETRRVVRCNAAITALTGYSKEELQQLTLLDLHPQEMRAEIESEFVKLAAGVSVFASDIAMLRKDGSVIYVDLSATKIELAGRDCAVAMFRDVSIRRKAQADLLEAKARYEDLYQNAPDMFASVEAETALVHECNQTLCAATGYSRTEILGRPVFDLYHPDCLDNVRRAFEQFQLSGIINNAELTLKRKDGSKLPVILNVTSVTDKDGKILYSRSSWRDVSDVRRFEDELQASNKRLTKALEDLKGAEGAIVQRARLSALGEMASGIAHDFNNVLMPIVGLSDFLIQNPQVLRDQEEALSVIGQINEAADDARNIVQRLRLIHRGDGDQSNFEHLQIDQIVKSAVTLTSPKWKEERAAQGSQIELKLELNSERKTVQGNASELREMMMNLLLNAVDAMPDGGLLSVKTFSSLEFATIEVIDTGIGMSKEQKERCLEAFYTTKGVKGTGLGLSMVNGIVERHNGILEIDSVEGEGTTIRIILPFDGGASVKSASQVTEAKNIAAMKILAVDDDPRSLRLIELLLANDGHNVIGMLDGKEALRLLKKEKFDLVVSDRAMPDVRGDAVLKLAKLKNPEGFTIMLTGFGDIMQEEGELPDGVDKVMSKPVTRGDFRAVIGKMLQGGAEPTT